MPAFTCDTCGTAFDVPEGALKKYPNWTPKKCNDCRPAGAAPRRPPASASRELNLPVAEVMKRFSGGPQTGVFTDGACTGNPGPGGWGAVRVNEGTVLEQRYGAEAATTNNRMELTAMIEGLLMVEPKESLTVYSDSLLVVDTLTKWAEGWKQRGWRRKEGPVKNLDLVQRAYDLFQERPGVRIEWIKAHNGSLWNEYADSLATAYAREML
ncbi:MAG: ribonuclease H [Dehalococcoidia bacterium]